VFEIGRSLREARARRGLDLDEAQRALRIRRRYLEALEAERFDLLPGDVYARGFLREYAEFLGLDGSLYVREFDERFAAHEERPIAAPTLSHARRRRAVPLLAALTAVVAVVVGLAAWQLGGNGNGPRATTTAASRPVVAASRPAPRNSPRHRTKAPTVRPQRLVLTAVRGDCWLLVRAASAQGRVLYQNTLHRGEALQFMVRAPLWIRFGDGANVDATIAGRPLAGVPAVTGNLLVRPS
jgi:hypothetical protein